MNQRSKSYKFKQDLIQTVKKLKRKLIPDHLFWDQVSKVMDAPASKYQSEIDIYDPPKQPIYSPKPQQSTIRTLEQRILDSDDFDVSNIKPQVPDTVNVTVEDDANRVELLIIKTKTLQMIPYFKKILQKTSNFQISIHSDIDIFRQIMLFLERNYDEKALHLTVKNVIKVLAASQFLEIPKISNSCLQFIADNHCALTATDFKFLTNQDIQKLLFSKSIFQFISEEMAFLRSQLVVKLVSYAVQTVLNEQINEFVQCSKCGRFTTSKINEQYSNQLFCDAAVKDEKVLHYFDYVVNPLNSLKKRVQELVGSKIYPFDLFVAVIFATTVVSSGGELFLLDQVLDTQFQIVFAEKQLVEFQVLTDLVLMLQNEPVMSQVSKQVKEANIFKPNLSSFALTNESSDFSRFEHKDLQVTGKSKFQTNRFNSIQRHNSLRESFEKYEEASIPIQTAQMDEYIDIYPTIPDAEESVEEEFVNLEKSEIQVDNFTYCKQKFNKYQEIKLHLNGRQRQSLLAEAANFETTYHMRLLRQKFSDAYKQQPFSAQLFQQPKAVDQVFFQVRSEDQPKQRIFIRK